MTAPTPLPATPEMLRQAVADGVARYFATRRARVQPFVDRHFSLLGSAAIHRAAVGWDILGCSATCSVTCSSRPDSVCLVLFPRT